MEELLLFSKNQTVCVTSYTFQTKTQQNNVYYISLWVSLSRFLMVCFFLRDLLEEAVGTHLFQVWLGS